MKQCPFKYPRPDKDDWKCEDRDCQWYMEHSQHCIIYTLTEMLLCQIRPQEPRDIK